MGSIISSTGVNGDFILPEDPKVPLLYIAGGIGITPFISHLRHLQHTKEDRDIMLIYAVSSDEEIAYREVLEASGITVCILTPVKNHNPHPVTTWRYIQAPYLTKRLLQEITPDIATRHVYISGPPALVDSVKRISKQAQAKKIKSDYFIGY
jgi:ferredoxin-NADP reductase